MSAALTYDAYLEIQSNGSCLAQLLDLPGCFGLGADQASALAALQAAIPNYFAWLRRHDDYTPDVRGPFAVTPIQIAHVQVVSGRILGAFFAGEDELVTNEDLDWTLALLDWSYTDLYALLTAAQEQPSPGGRTPRAVAEYTAQEQLWLISRIEPHPTVPRLDQLPGTSLDKLRQIWQAGLHRLRHTSDEERECLLTHDGEQWSLRKVLRRSILHVRMQFASARGIAEPA